MRCCWALAIFGAALLCRAEEVYRFDTSQSIIQIHLDTAGALRAMGHKHLIQAPIQAGVFVFNRNDPGKSSVELTVDAARLQVMDPNLSLKERQKIQATMQSERVLGATQYPEIRFKSLKFAPVDGQRLQITGELTVRDQTHPVMVETTLQPAGTHLEATGTSQFRQTTFGIRPVTAGLGTVRVRDEIAVSFRVVAERNR